MSEIEFVTEKTYIFTGSIYQIERKKDIILPEKKELLGRFIKYINIPNHGDIYIKGKAEFEYGFITFPYYDIVKEE
jgi:hypothetical protein